jgi:hypothetical protein
MRRGLRRRTVARVAVALAIVAAFTVLVWGSVSLSEITWT